MIANPFLWKVGAVLLAWVILKPKMPAPPSSNAGIVPPTAASNADCFCYGTPDFLKGPGKLL